jgi:hypothetical protein
MDKGENLERCSKIFISWQWGVTFIAGLIVIVASLSWAGGAQIASMKSELAETKSQLVVIQRSIDVKLDILIKRSNH